MRDVSIVAILYCVLFIVLTTPKGVPMFGLSVESINGLNHFLADLLFWAAALYICATGTMGAFVRQDRFGISQHFPVLNRFLSLILIVSPFLAVLYDARFVYILLGLLLISHLKSKTLDEKKIDFARSRAMSNLALISLFTMAMMLMTFNNYAVSSIFNFGSTTTKEAVIKNAE